jgi:hypothetical protein
MTGGGVICWSYQCVSVGMTRFDIGLQGGCLSLAVSLKCIDLPRPAGGVVGIGRMGVYIHGPMI